MNRYKEQYPRSYFRSRGLRWSTLCLPSHFAQLCFVMVFLGYPLNATSFFSDSSVPSYLGPPRSPSFPVTHRRERSQIQNNILGKRDQSCHHSPDFKRLPAKRRCVRTKPDEVPPPTTTPWHHNDPFARRFNLQELQLVVEPGAESLDLLRLGPDSCPIHPLFLPLLGLSNDVPDMHPALQLATRFLSSRHTLPFFHSLITTPLTILYQESNSYGVLLTHLAELQHAATGLTEAECMLTRQVMIALVPHITIQICPDPRLSTRWAYTERRTPPQYPATRRYHHHLPPPFPNPADLSHPRAQPATPILDFGGTNALINLSPCFLRILHPHTHPAPTGPQRLRAAYMLAITLLHELAHAVYMARFPAAVVGRAQQPAGFRAHEEHEPFVAGQRQAELGHALEASLFGGGKLVSLAQREDFAVGLGWQRWPGADGFYVRDARGVVVPLQRAGMRAPRWETVYAVSHGWVRRQFDVRFWEALEEEVGERGGLGGGLLRVEKVLGSRVTNYDFDKSGGGGSGVGDDGWSSPERGADSEGVVRPGQPFVDSDVEDENDEGDEEDE